MTAPQWAFVAFSLFELATLIMGAPKGKMFPFLSFFLLRLSILCAILLWGEFF